MILRQMPGSLAPPGSVICLVAKLRNRPSPDLHRLPRPTFRGLQPRGSALSAPLRCTLAPIVKRILFTSLNATAQIIHCIYPTANPNVPDGTVDVITQRCVRRRPG